MADAILNIVSSAVAFGDGSPTSNPKLRYFDWSRQSQGVPVSNPRSECVVLDPGQSKTMFDGTRPTFIDGTTQFQVTLNPMDPSLYRFTWVSGSLPAFRVARATNLTGLQVTITTAANGSATFAVPSGTPFSGVQSGDIVFIPGISTGDPASPFSDINTGYWEVLGAAGTTLQATRLTGQQFIGINEQVTVANATQFQIFSSTGVQVGDKVEISGGFAIATRKTYEVMAVNPKWVEVVSTSPLALETAAPGMGGMSFYTSSKRFVRIEVDQEALVRMNGDTGSSQRLSPVIPGDSLQTAWYEKFGPAWSLVITNRSASRMTVNMLTCE